MKIIIIRHGEPDYKIDGLTEKGKCEVELLADYMEKEDITKVYCSPLGRARLTAQPFLDRKGIEAEYCDWLREFGHALVKLPYIDYNIRCWDILPEYIDTFETIYSPTRWKEAEFVKNSKVPEAYDAICRKFDSLLLKHGYRRDKYNYIAEKPNHDTIVLVCHYGLTGVLLSHLMNCSPYSVWQHVFTAPTAVTTIYTEERKDGIALMRAASIGSTAHLYAGSEPASFSGRFCECFTDDTRHGEDDV